MSLWFDEPLWQRGVSQTPNFLPDFYCKNYSVVSEHCSSKAQIANKDVFIFFMKLGKV